MDVNKKEHWLAKHKADEFRKRAVALKSGISFYNGIGKFKKADKLYVKKDLYEKKASSYESYANNEMKFRTLISDLAMYHFEEHAFKYVIGSFVLYSGIVFVNEFQKALEQLSVPNES